MRCKEDYDVHVHGMVPLWDFICFEMCMDVSRWSKLRWLSISQMPLRRKRRAMATTHFWEGLGSAAPRMHPPWSCSSATRWATIPLLSFPRPLFALQVHLHVKVRIQHLAKVTGTERFHQRCPTNLKKSKDLKDIKDLQKPKRHSPSYVYS